MMMIFMIFALFSSRYEPPIGEMSKKYSKTLVLDLDLTLINGQLISKVDYEKYKFEKNEGFSLINLEVDNIQYYLRVYIRPHAIDLIKKAHELNYEIIIFTTALKPYADQIIDLLEADNIISYRLYRKDCTYHWWESLYSKDLRILGRNLNNVLIIDDDAFVIQHQPENAIQVKPYNRVNDDELKNVIPHLTEIMEYKGTVPEYLKNNYLNACDEAVSGCANGLT
eukprot:NODE_1202_length_1805_cov_0.628370.p2 type:complete len:225 gc:universal NODE_1202_length_1805_cov_0.628370:1438-764(-)